MTSVKFEESLKLDRDWRGFRRVFLTFCVYSVNNAISVKSKPFCVYIAALLTVRFWIEFADLKIIERISKGHPDNCPIGN